MQMHANTIFITGGTSGIGKGLAEAFHKLGNQVIISGRRGDRLQDICGANPGIASLCTRCAGPCGDSDCCPKGRGGVPVP
jgi:short-subunit dehydrogenase involved in D-alanine esterification of teichoic acids